MKVVLEILAIVNAAIGCVCFFSGKYDIAAANYALAAYLQSSANSIKDGSKGDN